MEVYFDKIFLRNSELFFYCVCLAVIVLIIIQLVIGFVYSKRKGDN